MLGVFTLFWWPLSHWFYPDWYHGLLGFESYDDSLVKIIGTIGFFPVLGMFFAAADPIRNRDIVITTVVFSVLMAGTYVFLIWTRGFPILELVNVALLAGNVVFIAFLYPWSEAADRLKRLADDISR